MTASSAQPPAPWTRRTWVVLALLVAALGAALPWMVEPWHPAMPGANDAAMYLACARSLVEGDGYSYLGQPFVIRPPGMSVLLAPIVATRGYDFAAINWMVSLFGVAAAAAIYAWCAPRLGEWVAAALAAAIWWNGMFQEFCNRAMSDVPGLATLFGCLLLSRWAARSGDWRRELVLGLAIGASAYLRSAALFLVPALAIERIVERLRGAHREPWLAFARMRLAWLVLVPALVVAPWSVRDARLAPRDAVEQTRIASYSAGMWHVDSSDPASARVGLGDVLARAPERTSQVLSLVGTALARERAPTAAKAFGAALLALAAWTLLGGWRASELYLFGYAATIVVYFGFHERLALPIWVLAVIAAVEALAAATRRVPRPARDAVLVLALAALTLYGPSPRARWPQIAGLHARYAGLAAAVAAEIGPEARVGAAIGWHYALFLDRPVWSLRFAWLRTGDARTIEELVAKHRLDYVVAAPFDGASRDMLELFAARFGEPRRLAGGYLFRVR